MIAPLHELFQVSMVYESRMFYKWNLSKWKALVSFIFYLFFYVLPFKPYLNSHMFWAKCKMFLILQYIPSNMHTVFALLCFVVVIHWLIFPYPSGLLHWHCGNLTIAPVPAKQPWRIWINTSCEFNMSDCITTTKQSTTKPCAYFLGYTVCWHYMYVSLYIT